MDDKKQFFYVLKNDDGSVGEFKPFEIGEIPTIPSISTCENACKTVSIEDLCTTINLCTEAIESLTVAIKPVVEAVCEICIETYAAIYKACTNNKRVVYLAIHAKKWRTRKKNRNRLIKYVMKRTDNFDKEDSDERN